MSEQDTKPETGICYMIKLKDKTATFLWTSAIENPLESSVDLKIKTHPTELLSLANYLRCPKENGRITFSNLDTYSRLLIYASIRPTVRSTEKVGNLAKLVLELNSLDAFYWASRFRELWWENKNYRKLSRIAKAFRLFFGLD